MSQHSKPVVNGEPILGAERLWTLVTSAALGICFVIALNVIGPLQIKTTTDSGKDVVRVDVSRILVDWTYYTDEQGNLVNSRNPLAVQSLMWVAFFIACGELLLRWKRLRFEQKHLRSGILPEDERSLLTPSDMREIYLRARSLPKSSLISILVRRISMDFRKSASIERVSAMLDSSLDLFIHKLDLRYNLLRYLSWLIPTLGFLGTVIGIAHAMAFAGSGAVEMDSLLTPTTQKLAVAFYTTMLALMQSGILVLLMSSLQSSEEQVINDSGQYCLENFVLRLMEPSHLEDAHQKQLTK